MSARRTGDRKRIVTAAVLTGLAVVACGGGAGPDVETAPQEASEAETRSPSELEAIYRARTDSARMRFTEADVAFMTGMIVHHGQALVMAALAPTHGASPQVRTLAARIANGQRDEIATMQRWLGDRGQPVPELTVDGPELVVRGLDGHVGHGSEPDDHARHRSGAPERVPHMPGMLTPEQLHALDEARDAEFDRLFLEYMIQHHQGAVDMVHELFATDGAAQSEPVFRIASDIQVDQITEIARMQRMLDGLEAEGGGP